MDLSQAEKHARPFRIGLDLGGTKTECILLDPGGQQILRERRPTPVAEGYDAIVENLCSLIDKARALTPEGEQPTVGIGIPGSMAAGTGLVRNANTTILNDRPLGGDIEARLGCKVALENDANCFTAAEAQAGAGRKADLVFGVIMGTGCGGGIAIREPSASAVDRASNSPAGIARVRGGPHGIGGEWGHVSIDPRGPACYCGKRGCIETFISGGGMQEAFAAQYGRKLTMNEIVSGARTGDAECGAAFDQFLDDFGRALGGLISILDPDAVVLGGGLSNIKELYDRGVERVRHYAFHEDLRTPILKNELGDSAGVIGAAWIGV